MAILGALPVVVALTFSGTANAASVEYPVAQAELVREAATPVVAVSDPLPPGPDMNNVNNGAINGALVGAVAGGVPGAVVGGLGGAAAGAAVGAGAGFMIGIGTVAAGTLTAAMVGCVTTGCLIDVPVFIAGLAAEAAIAGPSIAVGGVVGAAAGGALGAAALGAASAAVGAGVGAAIGAGAGAAGVPMPAPPIPALG